MTRDGWLRLGIPPKFVDHRLTSPNNDDLVEWVAQILSGERNKYFLIFNGLPGRMKSGTAWATMMALNEQYNFRTHPLPFLGISMEDLVEALLPGGKQYHWEGMDWPYADLVRSTGVVLLDDLGLNELTEYAMGKFDSIINHRYEHLMPTIITTNLDLTNLPTYVGDRTASRMAEASKVVWFDGEDRRRTP